MPAGWTLDGDIYVPPAPQEIAKAEQPEQAVTPPTLKTKYTDTNLENVSLPRASGQPNQARQALEVIAKGNSPYAQLAQEILNAASTNPEISFAISNSKFTRSTPAQDKGRFKNRSFYEAAYRTIAMNPSQAGDTRISVHEIIHAIIAHKLPNQISSSKLKGKKYKKVLDTAIADKSLPKPLRDIIRGYVLAAEKMGASETLWGAGPDAEITSQTITASSIYLGAPIGAQTKAQREGGISYRISKKSTVQKLLRYLKENGITEVDVKQGSYGRITRGGQPYYDVIIAKSDLDKITVEEKQQGKNPAFYGNKGYDPKNKNLTWNIKNKKFPLANDPDAVVEYGFEYGLGNIDEFLSEALSNPEFQKALNEIEMEGGKTVWQTIIDAIARILGIEVKAGSVLDVVSRSAFELATEGDLLLAGGRTPTPAPEVRESRREPAPLTQQDREYLDAVSGDNRNDNLQDLVRGSRPEDQPTIYQQWAERNPRAAELLQRATDAAAKAAGFRFGPVFHGTKELFNIFRSDKYADKLIYFSEREQFSREWARGRKPRQEVLDRINRVRAESKKYVDGLFEAEPALTNNERDLEIAARHFEKQKEFERQRLDGMTVSEAQRDAGIRLVRAYLKAEKIFDPTKNWREFLPQILTRLGLTSESEIEPSVMKGIQDGNYLIWEDKNVMDAVLSKYDAIRIQETSGGPADTIAVRDPAQIKLADAATFDDQGNIIPPSQRFQPTEEDIRYARREPSVEMRQQYAPKTEEEQKAFDKASTNKVLARSPQLAVAAVRMKNGEITAGEYADLVDAIDPFTAKGADPIPTKEKIQQYIAADKAGQVMQPIESGKEVEFRIDIPTYNRSTAAGDPVYAVTAHEPMAADAKGVGKVISFVGVAKVNNPTFMTRAISGRGTAADIAAGAGKFPLATVKGSYEPITELPADINDPNVWTEVGYNPIRSSFFVDTRSKDAVVGGSEAIMVGSRVFVKDAVLDPRPTGVTMGERYARIQMPRPAGMEPEAVTTKLESLGFGRGGIVSVVNEPNASFEGRTIIRDGKVVGIELNAAALKDDAAVERVLNHEIAESANADGALNALVAGLTPKERKEINDAITRLGYAERARTAEEAARAVELLAEGWRGRRWFERAVARVEAWANKLGYKLTRRAAEYIAARNVSEINAEFKQAYNKFINVQGEAREGRIVQDNNKILIGNLYQDQIKSESKIISPTGANTFNHGTLGMSGGLRWRFRIKSGTLAVSDINDVDGIAEIKSHIEKRGFEIKITKSIEQAFDETHRGDLLPVDYVFANEAFNKKEGFKSRSKIVRMSIDDFLNIVTPLPSEQSQEAQKSFDAGIKWESIPYLGIKTDENGVAKITGHEGRHRALVLKRAGYTEMPVEIRDRSIRWSSQNDPNDFDYLQNFPTQLESEVGKNRIPFPFTREQSAIKYTPQDIESRESRREDAIPTFSEGSPEASTLSNMKESMAKVDGASEGKPNPENKPTYKISEIASVWMDQGGDVRQLQDLISENTLLSPANAAKVAKVIAKQYDKQQQIAEAVLETEAGVTLEGLPEGMEIPKDVNPKNKRTVLQRVIDATTGVRVKPVILQVPEKTALKEQIRLKARETREAKKAQQETADAVVEAIKALELRGPMRAKQAQALAKRAAKVLWTSEKSMENFIAYAERVMANTNYDADLREAKAAQKRAKELSKRDSIAAPQRETLEAIGNIGINLLNDPREFADVVNHYLRSFKPVVSEAYVVVPDEEMKSYLSAAEDVVNDAKAEFEIEDNERLADKYGITIDELKKYMDAEEIMDALVKYAKREVIEGILNEKSAGVKEALRGVDTTILRADQRKLIDSMKVIDVKSLDAAEKQAYIRIGNNIIFNNNQTNGAEFFVATAKGQQAARDLAKNTEAMTKNKAWSNIVPALGSRRAKKVLKAWAEDLQSVADTFRNAFGKEAMTVFYEAMGMVDLDLGFTNAARTLEEIQSKMEKFYKKLDKKYKGAATNQDGILSEGIVGYLIQNVPEKGEADSLAQRRGLLQQDIIERRKSGDEDRMQMADRIQELMQKLDGETVDQILANLKREYPANYESLTWLKDELFPQYKDFLKQFDENFNDQANNYNTPNYLPIVYSNISPSIDLLQGKKKYYDSLSSAPKQSSYTIKRSDYTQLPLGDDGRKPKEIGLNLRKNAYNSLSDQITRAYTNPARQRIYSFLKTPESEEALGGVANRDFFAERIERLMESRERRGSFNKNTFEKAVDVLANIGRDIGTRIALAGSYQFIRQPADQVTVAIGVTGRADLMAKHLDPRQIKAARPVIDLFSIGRRGDASSGYKYINQMEGAQSRLERYYTEGNWVKAKEAAKNFADKFMAPLKVSDFTVAAATWMTFYRAYLAKNGIKFTTWEDAANLIKSDDVGHKRAAAYAENMTDIYQGSSDPTKMAVFAQKGKTGPENLLKAILVPFNSFGVQFRSRISSELTEIFTRSGDWRGKAIAVKDLGATIGGTIMFGLAKRFVLPAITLGGVQILYSIFGVDVEEPDEEKKKEEFELKWRQLQGDIISTMIVGGGGQMLESYTIDGMNYLKYMIDSANGSEDVLDDDGEVMSFNKYAKERAPFYRYRSFDNAFSLGILDIGMDQAKKSILNTKMVLTPEEMERFTPEEQRFLYVALISDWLYLGGFNDADFARMWDKGRRDMIKARKEEEKEIKAIRGR
jgi:hypothetical protein